MQKASPLRRRQDLSHSAVAIVLLILFLLPLYWTLVTSLKTETEIFRIPATLWPESLNTTSYAVQLEMGDFNMFRSFGNSMVIALSAMGIAVVLAVPASFAIGRYRFRGKKLIILSFLLTQMLPVSVLLTPMFIIFKNMKLISNWLSVILADATIGIPFSILILKNYFASIPHELEDAAAIDGCNRVSSFFRIFVPICIPGIVVCAIFSFLYAWGDLAYGMTLIQKQSLRPITAGIFNFLGQYGTKWSYLTAFAIVTIIPVALIFLFMQKYIISGLTSGAVKG
jgi:multiple sugar transport system permease protein